MKATMAKGTVQVEPLDLSVSRGRMHLAPSVRLVPSPIQLSLPKGPLARDAAQARALLSDEKQTAVVLVTLPEELPARETSTLASDIRDLRMPLGPLVVNAMPPAEATDPALDKVLAANADSPPPPELAGLLAGVTVLAARRRDADRIVTGLANDPGLPMLQLPRLPSNDLGPEEVGYLADLLAAALAV